MFPYIFWLANSLASKLPVSRLIFFFPTIKNFLKNSNSIWKLLRVTLQYFLLDWCVNDYISSTSLLWISWAIWHWEKQSDFHSKQLVFSLKSWWYYHNPWFSTINEEVIHYDCSQFYLFFFFPFITSRFSPFCNSIIMRPHFTKHWAEKTNKSASEPYVLKW